MSVQSQKKNMKAIFSLVSQNLSYIYGEKESGPNGAKKQFHSKSKAFLRALGNDLGLTEFKVSSNYGGIAVSGEITLKGIWSEGNGVFFELFQDITDRRKFLYRSISSMKDSSGGTNRWLSYRLFESADYEELLEILLTLRKSVEADLSTTATTDAEANTVSDYVA